MRVLGSALLAVVTGVGCPHELDGPTPKVASPAVGVTSPTVPIIVCNEQLETPVAVHGDGFSPLPYDLAHTPKTALPTLTLTRTAALDGSAAALATATYAGEPGGVNAQRLSWQSQQMMTFVVAADVSLDGGGTMLPPGLFDLTIENANGHAATSTHALAVAPRPTLADIDPGITCLAQGERRLDFSGSGFLNIETAVPQLFLNGTTGGYPATLSSCTAIAHPTLTAQTCAAGNVTLPASAVEPGYYDVTLRNPETAACVSTDAVKLRVAAPPDIQGITPSVLCTENGPTSVVVHGSGFLTIDGALPAVTVGGTAVSVTATAGCAPLETEGHTVESCTDLTLAITSAVLVAGQPEIVVTNPAPAGCNDSAVGSLVIVDPPDVTAVVPDAFCNDEGGTLTVSGTGFAPTATVSLIDQGEVVGDATVTFVSSTELSATFPGGLPAGTYDLRVDNGAGCDDVLPLAVEVEGTPLVLFVDPPVVYSGITVEATIYVSGLTAEASEVRLVGPSDQEIVLDGTPKNGEPNRIAATIPAALEDGLWDIVVVSDVGCEGVLVGGLRVTSDLSVTVSSIDPAYVWQGEATAITITSAPGDFVATPRAYLNPVGAPSGTPATNLRAVVFSNPNTLTGVVPAGLAPDQQYQVIVVNPDATVGIFSPLTVTSAPPPVIANIAPASLDANTAQRATVTGVNFATSGIQVSMVCRDLLGALHGPLTVTPVNGTLTATSFDATFPSDQVDAGSTCVVTLVNPDGASFRYSAISTKTPAQNLNAWRATTPMVQARRGLGLVAGRPTTASRYVYAVGGDDGTVANAKSSIEASGVTLFGDMDPWGVLPTPLPGARTLAGVTRVGRFVYVVGGSDGTAPVATVWRALVLDPLATPEVVDVGVNLDDEDPIEGIGPGTWIYRIAATFPDTDASQPNGESLPGEPFVVQLPDIAGLRLVLRWDAIPGATGYRVYRTPAAGGGIGELELLGTSDTNSFEEKGGATTADTAPQPPGALGAWHAVASLSVAREAPAVAVAPDPGNAARWYLYAFGGRSAGGTPVATWEFVGIDVAQSATAKSSQTQTLGTWTAGSENLSAARAEAGAFVVGPDAVEQGIAAGRRWIYIGPGRGAGGVDDNIDAGLVLAGGQLGDAAGVAGLTSPAKRPSASAGYGAGVANGFLFTFGGAGGAPSSGGISGEMCVGVGLGGCNPDVLPEVRNWNSLGISMSIARYLPGTVQESAFFFIAGGATGAGVTTAVDTTVQ